MAVRLVRPGALWLLCAALLCRQAAPLPAVGTGGSSGQHRTFNRASHHDPHTTLTDYMPFSEMEDYMKTLSENNPSVELSEIGRSHEDRSIWLVTIRPGADIRAAADEEKEAVWIEGGLHAREWISPAASFQLIDKLSRKCDSHCDKVYHIVPMSNPDGYEFSRTPNNRFWRKNRAPNAEVHNGRGCLGVDLNRNWNVKFGVGSTNNPCDDTYKGTHPFSEPETKALSEAMKKVNNLKLVVSLHSFGEKVLYPWGYTSDPPANRDNLVAVGQSFSKAAARSGSSQYDVTNSGGGFYYASGATDDWALTQWPSAYVYTVELPGDMFVLPAAQIPRVGEEAYAGLHSMLDKIADIDRSAT